MPRPTRCFWVSAWARKGALHCHGRFYRKYKFGTHTNSRRHGGIGGRTSNLEARTGWDGIRFESWTSRPLQAFHCCSQNVSKELAFPLGNSMVLVVLFLLAKLDRFEGFIRSPPFPSWIPSNLKNPMALKPETLSLGHLPKQKRPAFRRAPPPFTRNSCE